MLLEILKDARYWQGLSFYCRKKNFPVNKVKLIKTKLKLILGS